MNDTATPNRLVVPEIRTPLAVWRVRVSHQLSDFADIWPTLDDAHHHNVYPFQCKDVLEVWLATIGAARHTTPVFVRVDDTEGHPVMLLPLGLEKAGGVRQLVFPDGGVSDYNAPVVFPTALSLDAESMGHLWRKIVSALPPFDVALFTKMPATIGTMSNPLMHLGGKPDDHSAYLMDLAMPLEGSVERINLVDGAWFRDAPRKRRQLGKRGRVAFRVAETAEERTVFLRELERQKRRRYIETRGIDGFKRPGYLEYYRQMTARFGSDGKVSLCALLLDDRPLAVHWGIATSGHLYYLMPSFEAGEWAKFSPGKLILAAMIDWCRSQGMTRLDLGYGDDAYKLKIATETVPLMRIERPETMKGRAYLASMDLRRKLSAGPIGNRWRSVKFAWNAWRNAALLDSTKGESQKGGVDVSAPRH